MFRKKTNLQNRSNSKKIETIIGPAIKVKGNFNGKGNTVIEGELEGGLKTDSHVFIGDNAKINANIRSKTARIGGLVVGDIKIQGYLEIVTSANILGNIECGSLTIENGAIINGQIKMTSEENDKKIKPLIKQEEELKK